ncbi:hypothetical protein GJ631_00645 [Natronomonas sp. CBA1123]|uniref:surface carbohydrate biosynthesis protein n=1 Tax=Natronomonas sp. CBA1123 TaxID=2668070 RepID=UPI0012EAC84F|nr:surface carbohydrate biosynthesis protein [Natronomonas sp. CBA1123]MUV85125.1 hypothetical protein [Natronomonas sp. CBA1123]
MRVCLPVEIKSRELNGKLWLALNLLNKGHEVVVGKGTSVYPSPDVTKPDVMIFTSAFKPRRLEQYRNLGIYTIYLDTEGGVFQEDEEYVQRVYPSIVENVNHVFCWGEKVKHMLKENTTKNTKLTITGNPRFDLLYEPLRTIYKDDAENLKEKFGDYILINTNFSIGNYEGDEPKDINKVPQKVVSRGDWDIYRASRFADLAEELSKETKFNVIIRPHPSENYKTYKNHFSNIDGVYVEYVGNVRKWILGSEAVIHNSCTTGIESSLMGVQTFAYKPKSTKYDMDLPNRVSISVDSQKKLIELVKDKAGKTYQLEAADEEYLNKYINTKPPAVDRICREISNIDNSSNSENYIPELRTRAKRISIRLFGDENITRIRKTNLQEHWSYSNQAFPYTPTNEIESQIELFSQFVPNVGININRFLQLENTFLLTQE